MCDTPLPRSIEHHLRRAALGLASALTVTACAAPEPASDRADAIATARTAARDPAVTLITGDRVVIRDGKPSVTPGPGRERTRITVTRDHGRIRVVPEDVRAGLARGELDPALFDVTALLAEGFGDAERDDVPLIITGASDARGLAATGGLIVDRTLPAVHAIIAHQPKHGGAALTAARGLGAGARIWLDRTYRPALDRSVPQIGGPAARARGLTGAGVTVAVIDSGVDASHPDLVGKLAAAEDFTGDGGGVGDVNGHGTHVASIIAGTGAASAGRLAGVAPDARLISARVCGTSRCRGSAILAGIEWAVVEQHARIINLSLGGPDTEGTDPVEAAVDSLSAERGTLFVVSAGNVGGDETIASPASAAAALAVGAVDRADQLAVFSSRGPRVGGGAIKPELTAPGVGIVAARAAGVPPIGSPVDDAYQALSGTSMAAPHVAGAAALLLQQHPDWTGAELKAQLIASAEPNPALGVFAQGAGRIDVDRATRQAVTAEPATLDLGLVAFPHDDDAPTVHAVRYRNAGAAPVTLALTASLTGPAGPGVVAIEPATLTIAAGATADATLTVRTDGDQANGRYAGAVVATAGDVRVETPITIEREDETFDVAIDVIADGAPGHGFLSVRDEQDRFRTLDVDGSATIRLARGTYAVAAGIADDRGTLLFFPRFRSEAGARITFDNADAEAIKTDVGDPSVDALHTSVAFLDYVTGHEVEVFGLLDTPFATGQIGPELPADELVSWIFRVFADDPAGLTQTKVYNLVHVEHGHVPHGWIETIDPQKLTVVQAHRAGPADAVLEKGSFALIDDGPRGIVGSGLFPLDVHFGPYDRTELYFGDDVVWSTSEFESRNDRAIAVHEASSRYRPGQQVREVWNGSPAGPAFPQRLTQVDDLVLLTASAHRHRDHVFLAPSMVADTAGHSVRIAPVHQRIALVRDGATILERIDARFDGHIDVPPGPAAYRYEHEVERDAADFAHSTRVTAAWTFRSDTVASDEPRALPLLTPRLEPALDDQGTTGARVLVLPIRFERPAGAGTPFVVRASLEASFDDGARWTSVPLAVLGDRAIAVIVHPRGRHDVSLRTRATDLAGNQVDQTIVRAYTAR